MLVKYEKKKRYNLMKLGDKEKERQTQETVELMNGRVMGEVEDTFYFGGWGGDRAYIARRFPGFVRSSFSKEYNGNENGKQ